MNVSRFMKDKPTPWWAEQTGRRAKGLIPAIRAQAALTQDDFKDCLEALLIESVEAAKDAGEKPHSSNAAGRYYRLHLAPLTSRRQVQLFIAQVAQGISANLICMIDAKMLLYGAQLALAAFGTQNDPPPPPVTTAPKGLHG